MNTPTFEQLFGLEPVTVPHDVLSVRDYMTRYDAEDSAAGWWSFDSCGGQGEWSSFADFACTYVAALQLGESLSEAKRLMDDDYPYTVAALNLAAMRDGRLARMVADDVHDALHHGTVQETDAVY